MHPQFARDVYIQQRQPKSLLCSPIVQQGKLLGVLYLENKLVAGAFTSDRVELLNLLCAQAAISLENARLYQQSQQALTELRASETERKQAQLELQKLAAVVENSSDFVGIAALNGQTLYLNPAGRQMVGLDPSEDVLKLHINDHLYSAEDWLHCQQELALVFEQGFRWGELRFRHFKTGALIPVEFNTFLIKDPTTGELLCVATIIRDVTGRKQIEAERQQVEIAMRLSEERYRCLTTATSQIVWTTDGAGQIIEEVPLLFGYTGQSFEQAKGFGWAAAIHPDDADRTLQIWNHAVAAKSWYRTEYRLRGADGNYRYFDVRGVPILNEDGDIREWVGTCTDIDDRKRAEAELHQRTVELEQTLQALQRTQSQMVQSEKMSSLGQLVAGVAHEINNPVNFIFGNLTHANSYTTDILQLLELYQHHYPAPHPDVQAKIAAIDLDFLLEDLPKILSSMRIGADRIQKIVASLRIFSRMDEAEMKAVNIHDGIDSTLMILQHRLKAKPDRLEIAISKHYGDLPLVECYAGQLNQVFMNVLSNTIDALEGSIEINNSTRQTTPQPAFTITIRTHLITAHQVEIRVADNGPGMTETVRQRLFNPFFTTKPVGKGTGMGLSISYQIVAEKHGGSLSCISQPGQGAEFIIQIPIYQQVDKSLVKSVAT